ncbi:hypothetical protein VULLAG_LOCUS4366 [Vulpes lagopus]
MALRLCSCCPGRPPPVLPGLVPQHHHPPPPSMLNGAANELLRLASASSPVAALSLQGPALGPSPALPLAWPWCSPPLTSNCMALLAHARPSHHKAHALRPTWPVLLALPSLRCTGRYPPGWLSG